MAIVLFDIDHVLSDARWRDTKRGDWPAYHHDSTHDEAVQGMINLFLALTANHLMIFFTARPEDYRELTESWLRYHGLMKDGETLLMMRSHDCSSPAVDVKLEMFRDISRMFGRAPEDFLLIEDQQEICEAFQKLGVLTLQVRLP